MRHRTIVGLIAVCSVLHGCSAATASAVAASLAAAGGAAPQTTKALLLFGGENHKTFLGCLNCSEYDSESVFNQYGSFGANTRQRAS